MSQATIPSGPLSKPIRRALGRLSRRLRTLEAVRGFGTLFVLGSIVAALGMTADVVWPLPRSARWLLWGFWLAVCVFVVLARVVRPLVRRIGPLDLAAVAERANPALGERLTGAVGLLQAPHGSPSLIAALADEAAARAGAIDLTRAVPGRGAARWVLLGLATVVLLTVPVGLWPSTYGVVARRFLAPWSDLGRLGRFAVAVAPGDRIAAIGSDLTVSATVRPRYGHRPAPESAWLEWTDNLDGHRKRVAMPEVPASDAPSGARARSFAVTLPRLGGSLSYRVVCDGAESRSYRITAVEPPALATLRAEVVPPAYTKEPAALAPDPACIEAWEGSRIRLALATKAPVAAVVLEWPAPPAGKPRTLTATLAADGLSAQVEANAEASGTYTVALQDRHGLSNRPESPRRVVVRPDAPPTVAVQDLGPLKETSPDDVLRLAIAARDDIAVDSVELHYTVRRGGSDGASEASEQGHVAAKLAGLGTRAAKGKAELVLDSLKLQPGDALACRVRVADNRPAPRGPNVVWSAWQTIAIVKRAEPLQARQARADREAIQAKLDAIKKSAAENRKETEQLRYAADAAQRGNGTWDEPRAKALRTREADARDVADRLQLLARELGDQTQFRSLQRPARQIAEVEAEAARAMLERARRDEDPERRLDDLRKADARLAAVANRLDELQRAFDALGRRDHDLGRLRDLAAREEALAEQADGAMDDRARLDRLHAAQTAVEHDLEALLRTSPELKAELLASQTEEAQALARRARDLADRQRAESRRTADLTPRAGELKQLADAQRALEDDARRLALKVDEPLAENGRGRLNTDAIRQPAEAIERADIEQARQRLEGAEGELRRLARDLEDLPADPKALAFRLLRRHDAINARTSEDVTPWRGKKALEPQDKAELAAKLKPLAERQQAIVQLARALEAPKGQRDAAEAAVKKAEQAAEALRDPASPREVEMKQRESRAALSRLANVLPDPYQRQRPSRQKFDEARRISHEVARELERHLRETASHNGRPQDPARAAAELSRRLGPLAQRENKALEALRAIDAPELAPQRDRAVRRAEALAKALEAVRDQPDPKAQAALREALPAADLEARAALDRLEQKLNGQVPADELAAELAAEQRALEKQLAEPGVNRPEALAEQRRLASALRNLNAPDVPEAKAEAVRRSAEALTALAGDEPNHDPRTPARQAADAAEALASRLTDGSPAKTRAEPPAPADPALDLDPKQAAEAAALASRERHIRERLQAMLGEQAAPQEALRRESAELGRDLADLRERARPISPRAAGPAQEAAALLGEHAPRMMGQGIDQMAQARPFAARDAQRQAAELVERGAQQADDLAAALRADRPAEAEAQAPAGQTPIGNAGRELHEAGRALAQARDPAQTQTGQAAGAARQALHAAARSLRAAAQHAEGAPGQGQDPAPPEGLAQGSEPAEGSADASASDPQGTRAGKAAPDLATLQDQLRRQTGRAWGELPGHLRTEILEMSQGRYRDDYARLIQLYYREIAAGAAESPKRGTP